MNNLMIPPNPNWFMQSSCYCTPDNGLLYGAMSKIVYIPPKSETASEIRNFDLKNKLCAFAIDPEWSISKLFAAINADLTVLVCDFATGEVTRGHKGHESENRQYRMKNQLPQTAIAFLKQKIVLSSVHSNVISYCLESNTFKIFLDFSSGNPITIFKQSPKDTNLVAAGTKNGLILLISVDKMEVIARLRGHDTEVTSLDWIYLSMRPQKQEPLEVDKKSTLQEIIAATDTSDAFDIYEDNTDAEFGVYVSESIEDRSDDEEDNQAEIQEKIHSTSDFNFLEACSSLKGDILGDGDDKGDSSKGKFEDNKEKYGVLNPDIQSVDESLESNASSRTPVLTEESLNYLDECQRMKDFVIVSKEEIAQIEDIPVIASGSREPLAWLWDVNEKNSFAKIKWHPKPRPVLPTPFTNVLWIDQNTLLVTDGNGELNEYKVSLDVNTRVLSAKEQKDKKFDAKGILSMCKSEDGSLIWTSSIHRHISCLDVKNSFEKIVSLDTVQLRIHHIIENPIDSNVIAIGGNDKRICLWNTSEANQHTISLRPFMNKIHCAILCLSWHPEKDNILAFSTREGRVGVLDINKSTNLPTILPTFNSKEIYSLAFAKVVIDGISSIILITCDRHKLVYYSQKDLSKINYVDQLKHSATLLVIGQHLLVGSDNGDLSIVDISNKFAILSKKSFSKKYIGMMAWQNGTLAFCTETGISLTEFGEDTTEIQAESLVKLAGHTGRVFSIRFNKSGSRLVSCCIGGFVKVWDVEAKTVLSSFCINTPAYSAIFLPSNEDFVVCGGQDSTVLTIEWGKYPASQEVTEAGGKKKQYFNQHVQWATATEVTKICKNSQRRHKSKIEQTVEDENISELSSNVMKLQIQNKKKPSIFGTANRELNTSPLELIESILGNAAHEPSLNEKLFASRQSVKEVIENDLKQNVNAAVNRGVILPQLGDSLKAEILDRIAKKTVNELHVAVAPSVSHDLWRKSCHAFAIQCVENDDSMAAVPYFLALNDIDICIGHLCDGKFFREAFIIAKMRKEDEDPVFAKIIEKWVANLDYTGNYESAAALLVCLKEYKRAAEILEKRQNKSEKCTKVLESIVSKSG